MSRIPLEHALVTAEEVRAALARPDLSAWNFEESEAGSALVRSLRFPSFAAAIAFLGDLVESCDAMDHHPTWTNTYDRVDIRLTTHEAGDHVTARDLALAALIGAAFAARHGD